MTDEQAMREARARQWLDSMFDGHMHEVTNVLALLDAKDAEIAYITARSERRHTLWKEALSRAKQAEAALAERDAAIAEVMDRVHECSARYDSVCTRTFASVVEPLRRFILPAKPAVDPLVAVLKECDDDPTDTWAKALAANLRAAIERAGGVKAVFGEESDYDSLPKCIKDTEFTAGRRAGGTISFEGEG